MKKEYFEKLKEKLENPLIEMYEKKLFLKDFKVKLSKRELEDLRFLWVIEAPKLWEIEE